MTILSPRREYTGRHRPGTVERALADHLLSPAAYQLVSRTTEPVRAGVDEPTGFLTPRPVSPTGQFTTVAAEPAAGQRGEVLAELRASLADPTAHERVVDALFADAVGTGETRQGQQ